MLSITYLQDPKLKALYKNMKENNKLSLMAWTTAATWGSMRVDLKHLSDNIRQGKLQVVPTFNYLHCNMPTMILMGKQVLPQKP